MESLVSGYGLFWVRGDGKGSSRPVQESALRTRGLAVPHSVTLADLDHDGVLEIIALSGGQGGSITIWRRRCKELLTGVSRAKMPVFP